MSLNQKALPDPKNFRGIIKKVEKMQILEYEITRTKEGIKLFFKSPILENFFKSNSSSFTSYSKKDINLNIIYGYTIPDKISNSSFYKDVSYFSKQELFASDNTINLSFLRSVGIGKGLTFLVDDLVSRERLKEFIKIMKYEINIFAKEYLKNA